MVDALPNTSEPPLNCIVPGDCVAGMNALPAESVHLAFADPPFNIGYDYDVYDDKQEHSEYLNWSRQWIAAVHRALRPDGTFWLAIGDEYAAELKIITQETGFHCRSWVIWYYTFGVNCNRKFSRSHAHLFHFVKDPMQFTFREDEPGNRIPSARQLVYNDKRANPDGRLPDDTWIIRPGDAMGELLADDGTWVPASLPPLDGSDETWTLRPQDLAERFQSSEDTWYFPRVAGTFKERAGFHGCQMPEQLLGRIIRFCSHQGDIVMDPFSGSATTLVVAKKLGRRYLGFELSDEYVKHGQSRLEEVCIGDRLHGAPEPTMSAPETFARSTTGDRKRKDVAVSQQAKQTLEVRYEAAQLELTLRGIVAAFELSHHGYSADRVVADAALNAEFHGVCDRLGIVGEPRIWNSLLFRLRKAGQLSQIATTRKTEMAWDDCDPYLFACEIALQSLLQEQRASSLDEILCDPELALEFDRRAAEFAPGFKSLQYRWGALKVRKQSKIARTRGSLLTLPRHGLTQLTISANDLATVPESSGAYLVTSGKSTRLYAGESLNLRQRFRIQFAEEQLPLWRSGKNTTTVQWFPIANTPQSLLAWQACLARKYQPQLNLSEFSLPGEEQSGR